MKSEKGYTLLFAVIVSVLVLSIAAFILSVSRKQAILSSSARDSVYAFYAADSGLECALENLYNTTNGLATTSFDGSNNPHNISCGNAQFQAKLVSNGSGSYTTTFVMFTGTGGQTDGEKNQSGAASCATVIVNQYIDATLGLVTKIDSRGNNIGWRKASQGGSIPTGDCGITGPRKVERALRYTLFQ
ncbi:MAG TPA: hypothetical protein VL335_02405 [Candidatus Paceibacterota bacterium]|jgi:Tfp pilus assembly protein PilX|nr:hypothetical protein [Candidatus Paceibacterota bacterium]